MGRLAHRVVPALIASPHSDGGQRGTVAVALGWCVLGFAALGAAVDGALLYAAGSHVASLGSVGGSAERERGGGSQSRRRRNAVGEVRQREQRVTVRPAPRSSNRTSVSGPLL